MSKAKPSRPPVFSVQDISHKQLLGGLSTRQFMAEYWQKKPLLVRQALPGFGQWLNRQSLSALACRDDAESRLVQHKRGRWQLDHGPFAEHALSRLPKAGWSLLVSGVNHLLADGDTLLNRFDFVPRARLDDLMVSFAPEGGGVGPHFDSYDVFLIQGQGQRRWEISDQTDLTLVEDAPLRILQRFTPSQSWVLEPGDMLYLPPKYAHNGVALDDCMTWSVGFRAPGAQEIQTQFLNYLQDTLCGEGLGANSYAHAIYADPTQNHPKHTGEIPDALFAWTADALNSLRWAPRHVEDFLGRYLSEPKAHIVFDPPTRPLSEARFTERVAQRGLRLDPRSQLLFKGRQFYINGERVTAPARDKPLQAVLRHLADQRILPPDEYSNPAMTIFYDWYLAGYVTT